MPANLTPTQQRFAKVQTALNANGAQLDVDGKWGPKSSAALKVFQSSHKLKATGRMDPATAKALGV
jgi:peptidoglycan hydrolase-like protein with peptidoglycan-binding domain